MVQKSTWSLFFAKIFWAKEVEGSKPFVFQMILVWKNLGHTTLSVTDLKEETTKSRCLNWTQMILQTNPTGTGCKIDVLAKD